jgi:hypothetical protein
MASLLLRSSELGERVIPLQLGSNRLGRNPDCEIQIQHPAVSSCHCELVLSESGVVVRDRHSTNGTFLDGLRVEQAQVSPGQVLRLGDVVELLVESVDANVAIPEFSQEIKGPPIVLADGSVQCPRHPEAHAEFQCTNCRELMCPVCVHFIKRKGGAPLALCPLCSHACERIVAAAPKKKRSFLSLLQKTIRLPQLGKSKK